MKVLIWEEPQGIWKKQTHILNSAPRVSLGALNVAFNVKVHNTKETIHLELESWETGGRIRTSSILNDTVIGCKIEKYVKMTF